MIDISGNDKKGEKEEAIVGSCSTNIQFDLLGKRKAKVHWIAGANGNSSRSPKTSHKNKVQRPVIVQYLSFNHLVTWNRRI